MNNFTKLSEINVSDKIEKKNGLSFLSWSFAWGEFCKVYPDAKYIIKKNENNIPVFGNSEFGYMVYTEVEANGSKHEMWLPVMDNRNQAVKQPDMMNVNKAVMRCLTKNLAMFGLGLYIYSGEDLPETEKEKKSEESQKDKAIKMIIEISKEKNVEYNPEELKNKTAEELKEIYRNLIK